MGSLVQIQPGPPDTGGLAQLGERLLCKQDVVGSIPSSSTRYLVSFKFQVTRAPFGEERDLRLAICELRVYDCEQVVCCASEAFFKNLEEVID